MNINEKLIKIQNELKVPKEQYNKFGKYNFRSCEDIVENSKPILKEHNLLLLLDDEIVNIGERYYVKATAKLTDGEESIVVTGYAREEENKKGMDSMQLTGATSSYARKYALNGLFAIDDTKDSDSYNKHGKDKNKKKEVGLKEIRRNDLKKLIKGEITKDDVFTEYKEIMTERGHNKIDEPIEKEWDTIMEMLKQNLGVE